MTAPETPEASSPRRSPLRLVGMALLVFYTGALVLAAWPRLLQPVPDAVSFPQIAALQLLRLATIYPGQEVFSGEPRPRGLPTAWCFEVIGFGRAGASVLYDNLEECRPGGRRYFKDPLVDYHKIRLEKAFRHLENPREHRNLNEYPLNHLLAIADYHCRHAPQGVELVGIRTQVQTLDLDTGEHGETRSERGALECESGRWRMP